MDVYLLPLRPSIIDKCNGVFPVEIVKHFFYKQKSKFKTFFEREMRDERDNKCQTVKTIAQSEKFRC